KVLILLVHEELLVESANAEERCPVDQYCRARYPRNLLTDIALMPVAVSSTQCDLRPQPVEAAMVIPLSLARGGNQLWSSCLDAGFRAHRVEESLRRSRTEDLVVWIEA